MVHPRVLERLRREYEERLHSAEQAIDELHLAADEVRDEEFVRARRQLLLVEKDRILEAFRQGTIGPQTYESLLADIDARLVRGGGEAEET